MGTDPRHIDGMCKVGLRGSNPDDVETLWAFDLGNGKYRLDNLPWFAYRVSVGDVIAAEPDEYGMPFMTAVLEKSGNRTIRVIGETETGSAQWTKRFSAMIGELQILGCGYEGANRKYLALNIPPDANLQQVASILEQAGVQFEYADPTYEDIYPDTAAGAGTPAE